MLPLLNFLADRLSVTDDKTRLLELETFRGRALAAEKNTGLPCEVCGSKQSRLNVQRGVDGSLFVSISYHIPAGKVASEVKALGRLLRSFAEGL